MTDRAGGRRVAVIALIAITAVLALYGPTVKYGLYWDDLEVLHPWHRADLVAALVGPYRPFTAVARFYRPLASLYYALAFDAFAWNAWALHAFAVVDLAAIAWLTGLFVLRETRSMGLAALATVVYAAHPDVATSIGPWIANQDQGLQTLAVLVALLLWQRCRDRPASRWWPIAIPLVIAALFKEDALLLPLALPVMQWLRSRVIGDLAAPSRAIVIASVVLVVVVMTWRWFALGGLGGYGRPSLLDMLRNLQRGPRDVLMRQLGGTWASAAVTIVKLGALAGAALALRARARGAALVMTGIVIVAAADIPLSQISSVGRWHLLALGGTLLVTAGLAHWARVARAAAGPIAASALVVATVASLSAASRQQMTVFAPCSPDVLDRNRAVSTESIVPAEVSEWLASAAYDCAVPLAHALPVIVFSARPPRHDAGARAIISGDGLSLLVPRATRTLVIRLQSPDASAAHPVTVRVVVDGRLESSAQLVATDWHPARITFVDGVRAWLRDAHRVDIATSAAGVRLADLTAAPVGARPWR